MLIDYLLSTGVQALTMLRTFDAFLYLILTNILHGIIGSPFLQTRKNGTQRVELLGLPWQSGG